MESRAYPKREQLPKTGLNHIITHRPNIAPRCLPSFTSRIILMSTAANSYYFRRRTIGRTASPPTWACYEEIPYDDDYSTSCSEEDSCSEDDEDYIEHPSDSEQSESGKKTVARDRNVTRENNASIMNMETEGVRATDASMKEKETQRDVKGKQRAADPEPESTRGRRHKKERRPTCTLRPILTIHRSQGFVWNQDLFIPPYAKDRYVASTSPPNARGFISSSSSNTDYEVEVVEIRVKEGELFH
ncbi:hypothetical protein Ac2012v2_002780 [Leucoagaricus gongylophorus]